MARLPARTKLPEGAPLSAAPRRTEVSPRPLAGGGAGGGKIALDPSLFRDEWRRSRDGSTTLTVAGDLAEVMSSLDINLDPESKKEGRAAVRQFSETLRRVEEEHRKAPNENLLEPYQQAFNELIPKDPTRAAFLLEAANLKPETVFALGSRGFKRLLAESPRVVPQVLSQFNKKTAQSLISKSPPPPDDVPEPAPARRAPAPRPQAVQRPAPAPKPASVAPSKPPLKPGDKTKIVTQPGQDWTDDQISRGWRVLLDAPPAPARKSGDSRVAEIYIDREVARKQGELTRAGGPNSKRGKAIKAELDDSEAMRMLARASAEADLNAIIERSQSTVSAAKNPQELADAQQRLSAARAMLAEHMASFDAMTPAQPSSVDAPQAPKRVVEILSGRPATRRQPSAPPPPMTEAERSILRPPENTPSAIERLLDRNPSDNRTATAIMAGLTPEERVALEKAQRLADALRTGRSMSLRQEAAPNQIEGMQSLPMAQDTMLFDDTQQGRDIQRAITDLARRFPAIHGLLDTRPAIAPAPRDPLAPPGRRDFTTSLTHLMGGYPQARKFYLEDRLNNVPPSYAPLVKQADNVDALATITGSNFVPQTPAVSTTVGPLNKRIAREDLPANYKSMSRAEKKAAREALKLQSDGSTGDRAAYGVQGPEISAALALIDKKIPLQKRKRRIDLAAIEADYPEVVAEVRKIMEPVKGGGPIIIRDQVDNDISAWERRKFLARGRGRLTRFKEQLYSILEGKSKFVPKVLRDRGARATERLADTPDTPDGKKRKAEPYDPWSDVPSKYRAIRKANAIEFVQRMVKQGGIFPLDEEVPFWRAKFLFYDPDDGNVYFGRLTPGVLARAIMQMAEDTNPNVYRQLKDTVRRSMEVYERLPIWARDKPSRLKYADESGAPRLIAPTTNYMKSLEDMFEQQGRVYSPIPRMGNPWDDDAPARPNSRRFTTISPVTGLTK